MGLTVGFRRSGESLAMDLGEIPGSILSTSFAVLVPRRGGGVWGVMDNLRSSCFGTRLDGFGATICASSMIALGGVTGRSTGMLTEMGPVDTGDGVAEIPSPEAPERRFPRTGVSVDRQTEGSGESMSLGRPPLVPICAAIFFSFLMSDLYPLQSSLKYMISMT